MLSTENYPTDPSFPGDDERPCDKLKAVDLSTSKLEKGPKFSIRDYVFFTRNKDVVNSWPFSENNMQLCLKHGVKDLLPPFQSPDLVRNLLHVQDNVESALVVKENRCDSIREPSESSNHFESVKSNQSGCYKEHRSTTTTQTASKKPTIKKRRLIMKYSNIPHSITKEATTVNAPMSSEAVAVCPVCRTFSSLSNTTLNAHIDQCLSGEYTAKAVSCLKTNRQRIKPRKIKLMVDIYKTAPYCTLEDLDRRNGSNWASNCTVSPPEVEKISADPKGLCLNAKETNCDGSVYVDSNGTKLCILSKFSNPATISSMDIPQKRKLLKEGKGSMGLLAKKIKKMRNQIQKQQKCMRLDNHGKKITSGQDGIISRKEIDEKNDCMEKHHKASDQVKLTETTKGWVRSTKTDVMKKINTADDKWLSQECLDRNLLAKRSLSSITNSHVKKLSDLKFPNANSLGKSGRNDNSSYKAHDESRGNLSLKKRKKSFVFHDLSEHGVTGIRQNGLSYHQEDALSPGKSPIKIRKTHVRNADNSVSNRTLSSSHHALVSKTGKFSSLSKKLSSALDSRFSPKRKFSAIKKFKVVGASESDEEETPSHSETDQSKDFSRKFTNEEDSRWGDTSSEEESNDKNVVRKVRTSGESIISREVRNVEAIVLKSLQSTSVHSHHDPDSWNKNVSLMLGSDPDSSEVVGGQITRFSDSAEAGFLSLPGRFIEEYKLPLYEAEDAMNSTEPVLTSAQDIFGANLITEDMRIENVCVLVDQIPIPGPPGSFLPSPRHMDSDDLQGHSSLTSTRVQSHDDHRDFADQTSSDSHASDTSTVSNSNIPRSDSEPSEKLSVIPPSNNLDISRSTLAANIMETTCPPKTKLNNALTEIPSPNHPCHCSRKEVLLKNVGLNYQDSPLLRRRTMGGTQMSCGPNGTLDNPNSSSSLRHAVQVDNSTKSVPGIVSSSVYNNDKEESVSPAPSTPVLRLMGKNLMVINKDENDMLFHLKHSVSNSAIGHGNLQAFYTDNLYNEERHTVPRMTFQDPCFFHRAETYGAGLHHTVETLSKVVGNYAHSGSTPQANAAADYIAKAAASHYTPPQVMGFVRDDGMVCVSGMSKYDPQNTSPRYETQEYVYGRPVRSLVDSSGLVQHHPNGAINELVKWNYTVEATNVVRATLNTRSFAGGPFRFE